GGTGAGTVANGGSLELNGGTITHEPLTPSGTGVGGRGALVGVPGTSSVWQQSAFVGQLVTVNASTIGVDAGATIDLATSLTMPGLLTKLLPGTLRLSGGLANIGTGGLTIVEGTVRFAKTAGTDALAGGILHISGANDVGMQDDDVLIEEASEQINAAVVVQVAPAGLWNLGGFTETIGNGTTTNVLNLFSGLANRPHIRNGTLILGGTTNSTSNITSAGAGAGSGGNMLFSTPGAIFDADLTLNLGGFRRDFNLAASGQSQNILQINGPIANGQINKVTGTGTLVLNSSANSYAGFSEVQTLTNGGAASGTFTLNYRGATTVPLAFNAPTSGGPGSVQTELENLPTIGVGNVLVTGAAGGPYTITFQGTLANRDISLLGITNSGPTFAIAETTPGGGTLLAAGTIAVGSNTALGTGGLSFRSTGNNITTILRSDAAPVTVPNVVDEVNAANAAGFFVAQIMGSQPITFSNTWYENYNVAGQIGHILVFNPTVTWSGAAAAGTVAIDLGNFTLNFRNAPYAVSTIS